jgi:hypothetical protein
MYGPIGTHESLKLCNAIPSGNFRHEMLMPNTRVPASTIAVAESGLWLTAGPATPVSRAQPDRGTPRPNVATALHK